MFNQVGGMPAAPVEILMSLLGGPVQGKATGIGDFSGVFDLLGSAPSVLPESGRSPSFMALSPKPGSDTATLENMTLLLPQNLAGILGIDAATPVVNTDATTDTESPQSMLAVKAELLSVDDGNQQAVYLKILPETLNPETDAPTLLTGDKKDEMVLPMRLRTVERQGDRILADAELLTATGKDSTIRLKLELAGNPTRIQDSISKPVAVEDGLKPTSTQPSLSRLLHNLDVKSMVIEQTAGEVESDPNAVLPRTAVMPRNLIGQKPTTVTPVSIKASSSGAAVDELTPWLITSATGSKTDNESGGLNDLIGSKTAFNDIDNEKTSMATPKVGVNSNTTMIPVSEIGVSSSESKTGDDSVSVRFYNIENKLDQLKQAPGQKIRIQLLPSRLGSMELSIASQRGVVTVNLSVESVQAKQAVEKNLSQLESHLASSGIRVDNFQLHVNQTSRGASYTAYQQQYDRQQGDFTGRQGRGFQQYSDDRRRMQQFNPSDGTFRQAMVNCLA